MWFLNIEFSNQNWGYKLSFGKHEISKKFLVSISYRNYCPVVVHDTESDKVIKRKVKSFDSF